MIDYIGVDIGKRDLFLAYQGQVEVIRNDAKSLARWVVEHPEMSSALWVYEPTGGYEYILKTFLSERGLSQHCVHANHIRHYAKARGILAKTDRVDAKMIKRYAEDFALTEQPETVQHTEIQAVLKRREQVVQMRKQEKNRLESTHDKAMQLLVKKHIKHLDKEVSMLDTLLDEQISKDEALSKQRALYESVPGIGRQVSAQLVLNLPELLTHDSKVLAALVGVAPMNRDSGQFRGHRYTCGGRHKVRCALYMSILSAIRYNREIKKFYTRLKATGKPSKVAMVACMRKLLMILKSIAVRQTPWVDEFPPKCA